MPIKDAIKIIMQELGKIRVAGHDDCRRMSAALENLQAIIDALDANAAQKKEGQTCS